MASGFDPYYKWLGIPSEEQPPNHYRLLGLRLFEHDPDVIEAASDQRMAHLRTHQTGQYSALSQKLLNEVAGAKVCLLSPERRARYDETLKAAAKTPAPVEPLPVAAMPGPCQIDLPRLPVVPVVPLQTPAVPPPLPDVPMEPMAPPAIGQHRFDLEQLGVSDDSSGGPAAGTASGTGRQNPAPEGGEATSSGVDAARGPGPTARPGQKMLIAVLAACALLLGLVTAVVYFAKGKRVEDPTVSQGKPASAAPAATVAAAKTAISSPAEEELQALKEYSRELSAAGPLSPLRDTRLGPSLWLHMNFQGNTIVEHDKMLFVKDLSGLNHHGVCRRGSKVPGPRGDALQCETPLRLLFAAVNQVPQFTLLAWVRCPQSSSVVWWFDEEQAGKSLFGVGSGSDLCLRAVNKSTQRPCAVRLTRLATPPEQWNFIALRSEVRDGDTYLVIQVNDRKFPFNNSDLFPVQADGERSRAVFADTPPIQLAELLIFRAALGDGDIQALRSNARP